MEDLQTRMQQLTADAAECDLIANLATEKDKQEAFRNLAEQYRKMADAIRQVIADRS